MQVDPALAPAECEESGCRRDPKYAIVRIEDGETEWKCGTCTT